MYKHSVALVMFGKMSSKRIGYILNILGVNYKIVLPNEIPDFEPTHIILSGGPKHVYENDHYPMPKWVLETQCPVLGICYGMQIIAHTFGGIVNKMVEVEHGPVEITEIIDKYQMTYVRWMNRNDRVFLVPNIFDITAVTNQNHIAAFTDYKKWWAVQYHPESYKHGDINVFRRFLTQTSSLILAR